jgi:hypothetical protein
VGDRLLKLIDNLQGKASLNQRLAMTDDEPDFQGLAEPVDGVRVGCNDVGS